MLIDLLAPMAKLDNDKRRERIKQGLANSGYMDFGKPVYKVEIGKGNQIHKVVVDSMTGKITRSQVSDVDRDD